MTFDHFANSGLTNYSDGNALTATNFNTMSGIFPPIKTILPWAKSLGVAISLPDGWHECDGSVVSDADSPLNGVTLPNLNSVQRFLRGSTTSGTTGGSDTNSHTHTVNCREAGNHTYGSGPGFFANGSATTSAASNTNNMPAYYEVVFIIRIK